MQIDLKKWLYGGVALGILALLLIPTNSGPHGPSAEVRATKAQYSNYVTALHMFKGEYGSFPTIFEGRSQLNISTYPEAEQFIEAISGRDRFGEPCKNHGNLRALAFHSFSERELTKSKELGYQQIVDRMGNTNIVVCIDHDGDGYVEVIDGGELKQIRTAVTIYTIPKDGEQAIRLWE